MDEPPTESHVGPTYPDELSELVRRFSSDTFTIRQKFFRVFGNAFHLFDGEGNLVLFAKQKRFRIKEDFRLYADESQYTEILRIATQSIFDIAGTYGVIDSMTGQTIGAVQRKALKSFVRDEWHLLDEHGQQVGVIQEDSMGMALLRRVANDLSLLFPQKYTVTMDGQPVAEVRRAFNLVVTKVTIDFTADREHRLDRRVGIAAAILLNAIEGRE